MNGIEFSKPLIPKIFMPIFLRVVPHLLELNSSSSRHRNAEGGHPVWRHGVSDLIMADPDSWIVIVAQRTFVRQFASSPAIAWTMTAYLHCRWRP
ncbi:MAG: hypothetical protein ACLQIK_11120 [Mycobacterium sp.]|uniref:hypothetical protein n=1 Tax=Mycobacterium sp. TaxID=1785 RepID=UPI003F97E85E